MPTVVGEMIPLIGGTGQLERLAGEADRPGVRRMRPREDLDEGGLARAVLSHQRMRLTGVQLEAHAPERGNSPERLRHAVENEQRLIGSARRGTGHRIPPMKRFTRITQGT